MNEAMLKEIITRILSAPELQSLLTVGTESQVDKPGCLIVLNNQEDVCLLPELEERYHPAYSLRLCVTGQVALDGIRVKQVSCDQAMNQTGWGRIHVPVCLPEQLAQIALGLCSDQTSKLVAWAIAAGIPVEIGQVQWGFTSKTPEKYRQMFENYARQVADFGVVIAGKCSELPESVCLTGRLDATQSSPAPLERPIHPDITYEKRLLSDKEALRLPNNGVLRIAKSTVLTPGAIDVLKQQKVEVYREGVRCL